MADPSKGNRSVRVRRVFETPIERVWQALRDPEMVMRWWGPTHFTSPRCRLDFREGGTSILCMRSPAGVDLYNTWEYGKIVPMERIEFTQNLCDQDGNPINPTTIGLAADFPKDIRSEVTLKRAGNKTVMTFVENGFSEGQLYEFAQLGLNQSLDKMERALEQDAAGNVKPE